MELRLFLVLRDLSPRKYCGRKIFMIQEAGSEGEDKFLDFPK